MKPSRLRTMIVAVLVVSGSVAAGIGLGKGLKKVAFAQGPGASASKSKSRAANVAANRRRMQSNAQFASAGGLLPAPGLGGGVTGSVPGAHPRLRVINFDPRTLPRWNVQNNAAFSTLAPPKQLPLWDYSITASSDRGGGSFSGTIMGRDPRNRGKATTTIALQLVPLVITIDNGSGDKHTYDPTVIDGCLSVNNLTDIDVVTGSPLFTSNTWMMNGVNVGNTQYIDAFQRGEFWQYVGGTNYHLIFSPSTLTAQTLTFGSNGTSGPGSNNDFGYCAPFGVVQVNDLDNAVYNLITGPLAAMINTGTFPVFVMSNVVMTSSGTNINQNCCILGYHNAFTSGGQLQVYSPANIDINGGFGPGYTSALAHELGEAVNDPTGGNPTPAWGGIGQVGGCQNNFEVGDPLSGTDMPQVVGANGLTYNVQEMAFFSWYYGPTGAGNTSLGAGGKYSSNGTFGGDAKACPPGGTN